MDHAVGSDRDALADLLVFIGQGLTTVGTTHLANDPRVRERLPNFRSGGQQVDINGERRPGRRRAIRLQSLIFLVPAEGFEPPTP